MEIVEPSPLERRIRRVAVIVPVLAVVAAVLGMIPGGLASITPIGETGGELLVKHPMIAGGWTLVAWTAMHGLIARHVYRNPTRTSTWKWFGSALASLSLGLIVWAYGEHSFQAQSVEWHRVGDVMGAFMGAVVVLLLIALPIIALASGHSPTLPVAPTARVVV